MIKLERIKRIADDILSDVEWVNDSHSEAEYKGVKDGLNRLIRHIEYTHNINDGLIAEFMGIDQVDIDTYQETNSNLKYHTSWDWLMPVVMRCYESDTKIEVGDITHGLLDCDLESTHKAVVEFIKTYNKTK